MNTLSKVFSGLVLAQLLGAFYLALATLNVNKEYGTKVKQLTEQAASLEKEIDQIRFPADAETKSLGDIATSLRRLQVSKGGVWFLLGKLDGPDATGVFRVGAKFASKDQVINPLRAAGADEGAAADAGDGDVAPEEAPPEAAPAPPADPAAPPADGAVAAAPAEAAAPPVAAAQAAAAIPGGVKGVPFPQGIAEGSVLHLFKDNVNAGGLQSLSYLGAFRVQDVDEAGSAVALTSFSGYGPNADLPDPTNPEAGTQFATNELKAIAACGPETGLTAMTLLPNDEHEVFASLSPERLQQLQIPAELAEAYLQDGKKQDDPTKVPLDRQAKRWILKKEFKAANAPEGATAIPEQAELLLTDADAKKLFESPADVADALPEVYYQRPLTVYPMAIPQLRNDRANRVIELVKTVKYQKMAEATLSTAKQVVNLRETQLNGLKQDLAAIKKEVSLLKQFVQTKQNELAQMEREVERIEASLSRQAGAPSPREQDAAPLPALPGNSPVEDLPADDNSAALERLLR